MKYLTLLLLIIACNDPVYKEAYKYTDCGVTIESPYLSDDLVFSADEVLTVAIRLIQVIEDTIFVIPDITVIRALDSLNSAYRKSNIEFRLIEEEVYTLENIDIANYKQDILMYKRLSHYKQPAIDVFIYPRNSNFYPGVALSIKGDALAIQSIFFTSNTLIHEIGHCLGLHHTHNTAEGTGYDGGDFICDTPETGIISGYIDYNCAPRGAINGLDDIQARIIIRNYMSYVNQACRKEFTKDQIDKMRFHINKEPLLRNTLIFK